MESQRLLIQLMGGELMLEEPSQRNRQIFQMLQHLLMEELMLKEGDEQMG